MGRAAPGDTLLSAGWSRYYGSEVLETALEAERSRLRRQVLDSKGKPVTDGGKEYFVDYRGLRMPYDDEWAVSLRQRMAGIEGLLSYVHRNGRDQWTKSGTQATGYTYNNDGFSTTDGVSLTLRTLALAPGADALEHAGLLELAEAQDQRRPGHRLHGRCARSG
ncbi:hypothetical protein WJ972_11585 [Achromobacter insuavis]